MTSRTMKFGERLKETAKLWRERAEELRRFAAAEGAATAWHSAADEVESLVREAAGIEQEELTLTQAARETGYSPRHIRRLVSAGKVPNRGRKHAPRIRRGDLPGKNPRLTPKARWPQSKQYDDFGRVAQAIARGEER